jgi:hypothetical protein
MTLMGSSSSPGIVEDLRHELVEMFSEVKESSRRSEGGGQEPEKSM